MRSVVALLLTLAASASARTYSLKVIAPGRQTDGKTLHASGGGFFTGLKQPSTYCPSNIKEMGGCPPEKGTLVVGEMQAMAVRSWASATLTWLYPSGLTPAQVQVPGGQRIYIAQDGAVSYTSAHSGSMGGDAIANGWYNKRTYFTSGTHVTVVGWKEPGSKKGEGGLLMCPVKIPGSPAKYKLYANRRGFNQKDCKAIRGIKLVENAASTGTWQYS